MGSSKECDPFERVRRRRIYIDSQKCIMEIGEVDSPDAGNATEFDQRVRSAEGLLLVYNIASNPSFCRMQVLHELVRRFRESVFDDPVAFYETMDKGIPPIPVGDPRRTLPTVMVGCRTSPHGTRQVFTTAAQELAKENGCGFLEVSALDDSSIELALAVISRLIIAQRKLARQPKQPAGSEQLDSEPEQDMEKSIKEGKMLSRAKSREADHDG